MASSTLSLADRLILSYTRECVKKADIFTSRRISVRNAKDAKVVRSVQQIVQSFLRYNDPNGLDAALDTIDLPMIYQMVDQQENSPDKNPELGYEDLLVKSTLKYFKDHFFKWFDSPKCNCGTGDSTMEAIGHEGPPSPNPDEITVTEVYRCKGCRSEQRFSRINNPVRLLQTRQGRCGEWVNCFMLVLKAVLGPQVPVRYVWNAEDHVWCEYYSTHLDRWVHLDPCENAFDNPGLYCENWGKRMSWVVAVGDTYVADVSDKYILREDRRIAKSAVAHEGTVARFIDAINASLLKKYLVECDASQPEEKLMKTYRDVLVPRAREKKAGPTNQGHERLETQGRQSGSKEWTQTRGEGGSR